MAIQNTDPIYSKVGDVQWVTGITAANANLNLTSGTNYPIFTADATNGGFVTEVRVRANPSQNTAATVARLWMNNGSTTATKANSALIAEVSIAATTASSTLALTDIVIPVNIALPPGYQLILTIGTAPGGSGEFMAIAIGGKY